MKTLTDYRFGLEDGTRVKCLQEAISTLQRVALDWSLENVKGAPRRAGQGPIKKFEIRQYFPIDQIPDSVWDSVRKEGEGECSTTIVSACIRGLNVIDVYFNDAEIPVHVMDETGSEWMDALCDAAYEIKKRAREEEWHWWGNGEEALREAQDAGKDGFQRFTA